MPFGPGKYDDICTLARMATGGSVVLIVVDGNQGAGLSCQATPNVVEILPRLLRQMADQIEKSSS